MIEAQALVDAWICTPFDSGPEALDDLIVRIAAALASRDLLIAAAKPVSAADPQQIPRQAGRRRNRSARFRAAAPCDRASGSRRWSR
jgi:hypothetical protein